MKVQLSASAREDYWDIYNYVLERFGKKSASKFRDSIAKLILLLGKTPKMYPLVPGNRDLRQCTSMRPTIIYYTVSDSTVEILHIFDGRKSKRGS